MSGRGRGRGRGKYTPPSGAQLFLRRSMDECGLGHANLRSVEDITRPALFPSIRLHSTGDQRMLLVEQQQQRKREEELAQAAAAGVKLEGSHIGASSASKPLRTIPRSAQTVALIGKMREMHHRMSNSVHYVRPSKDVPDVVRYSEQSRLIQQRKQGAGGEAAGDTSAESDAKRMAAAAAAGSTDVDATVVLSACLGGRKRTRVGLYVPEELACGQRTNVRLRSGSMGGLGDAVAANKAMSLTELEEIERKRARSGSVSGRGRGTSLGGADDLGEHADEDGEEDEGEDYVMNYYESEGDEGSVDGGEATF